MRYKSPTVAVGVWKSPLGVIAGVTTGVQKFDEGGEGWSIIVIPIAILVQLAFAGWASLYYRDLIIVQAVFVSLVCSYDCGVLFCLLGTKRNQSHIARHLP